jgi:hypothetical protein
MKTNSCGSWGWLAVITMLLAGLAPQLASAHSTPQTLPFVQNWTDAALITNDNDWSKVPGFMGYRGDKLTAKPGANPQMITADGTSTPVCVLANQSKPNALRTGGVAEFDGIPDPVVALKGSATASAPFLLLNLNTTGKKSIAFGYKLRDIDGSANNAIQPVAFQYRVGTNGNFIDLPGAYAPDASTGPSLATLVTPIVVLLPTEANNQPLVQVRWITANAEGNDEWIGIAAITAIGDDLPAAPTVTSTASDETNRTVKALRSPRAASNP